MASKLGLAGGIPERRVRPIWDAIDSRQFKNALKHCTTLLSKYPNSPYALALKALVLERMGKPEEAFEVSLNAKQFLYTNDSLLIDDLTLSTLQIVFQRLDHCQYFMFSPLGLKCSFNNIFNFFASSQWIWPQVAMSMLTPNSQITWI